MQNLKNQKSSAISRLRRRRLRRWLAACVFMTVAPVALAQESPGRVNQSSLSRAIGLRKHSKFIQQPSYECHISETVEQTHPIVDTPWAEPSLASLNQGPVQLVAFSETSDDGTQSAESRPTTIRLQLVAPPTSADEPQTIPTLSDRKTVPSPTVTMKMVEKKNDPIAKFTFPNIAATEAEPRTESSSVAASPKPKTKISFVANSTPVDEASPVGPRMDQFDVVSEPSHRSTETSRVPSLVRVPSYIVDTATELPASPDSIPVQARLSDDSESSVAESIPLTQESISTTSKVESRSIISQPPGVNDDTFVTSQADDEYTKMLVEPLEVMAAEGIQLKNDQESVHLIKPKTSFPTSVEPTVKLEVSHMNAQVVKLSAPFERVLIEDDEICSAVCVSANEFSIVGKKVGKTKAAIIVQQGDQSKPVVIDVSVSKPYQVALTESTDGLQELTDTISKLHPTSKVEIISSFDGSMTVQGKVPDEMTAKQIMMLIRKMCLVPVYDKLIVSSR